VDQQLLSVRLAGPGKRGIATEDPEPRRSVSRMYRTPVPPFARNYKVVFMASGSSRVHQAFMRSTILRHWSLTQASIR
jgi:hypothetical protein